MKYDEQVEMQLLKLLADRSHMVGETALQVRSMVRKLAPGCSELFYKTYAVSDVFTFSGKLGQAFMHIAVYSKHINLGFNQGSKLSDPDGMLTGSGKLIRHIRIDSLEVAKKKNVKQLMRAAVVMGREMAEAAGGIQEQTFSLRTN